MCVKCAGVKKFTEKILGRLGNQLPSRRSLGRFDDQLPSKRSLGRSVIIY